MAVLADHNAVTRKEKSVEVRTIGLFLCPSSCYPNKSIFCKFNIHIYSPDIVVLAEDESDLHPTATFFEQEAKPMGICRVSCCVIRESKLFILPSEEMRSSRLQYPLQFNILKNQTDVINYPRAPKLQPYVIPIQDKVYALSTPGILNDHPFEPCFEAYHTTIESWEALPKPPFYDGEPYSCSVYGYFVVTIPQEQGETSYIVVFGYFFGSPLPRFFSYNTRTSEWKPVSLPEAPNYKEWVGEAVVVGDHAYVYTPMTDLRAFRIHYREATDDFSFGLLFRVRGLPMLPLPETCNYYDFNSTSMGIIRDRMFCLASTSLPDCHTKQFALVSIVQIREDNAALCDMLNFFMLGLPTTMGKSVNTLMITSCFALAPGVTSSMEQIEEGRNRKDRVVQDITDCGNISSDMEMTSYVM